MTKPKKSRRKKNLLPMFKAMAEMHPIEFKIEKVLSPEIVVVTMVFPD